MGGLTGGLSTIGTMAALTLREAGRRKVVWALAGLTVVLLALDAWGFAKLPGLETDQAGQLTTGEARVVGSLLLNLVMFTMSLVVALGTAFLAGPTLSGEVESGVTAAMLARPVRRAHVLIGKWLGLVLFASGYVAIAGTLQLLVVRVTIGYVPPDPVLALVVMTGEAVVLLTLALMLASVLSPMASGVLAVGFFGAAWVAGVVGGVGEALGNESVARIGDISQILLPTDGLWQGVMRALQAPGVFSEMGADAAAMPFLSTVGISPAYGAWTVVWILIVLAVTATSFSRRDI